MLTKLLFEQQTDLQGSEVFGQGNQEVQEHLLHFEVFVFVGEAQIVGQIAGTFL